ncbi:hypothetical protein OPV22_016147 [Ensete ventricosum]|uniref:Uncharacterized protein n=1 Tax=Ensete ventricosum TaxID=4639 RepID=A0AAV8QP90_ENSVE|nr:hypothetical protein OPV22_016147 [Ensete ventricosum]
MKMPSLILRDKVNMEEIKPWIATAGHATLYVYHVASSERCILTVGAKLPCNTRFFRRNQTFQGRLLKTVQVSIFLHYCYLFHCDRKEL